MKKSNPFGQTRTAKGANPKKRGFRSRASSNLSLAKKLAAKNFKKLKNKQTELLLDKLSERLAFERSEVRLYEDLIGKISAANYHQEPTVKELIEIQDEKLSHFQMLTGYLKDLGADPTIDSPGANITSIASSGILKVLSDPRTTIPQCLSALLTAELTNNEGWQILVQIAENLGLTELADQFEDASATEEEHLEKVRGWLTQNILSKSKAAA